MKLAAAEDLGFVELKRAAEFVAFGTATVTLSNWNVVRDYIFYGPPVVLTPGLGSFFFSIADRLCSRKTMHMIVIPTIADLRLEYVQAVREGRFASAVGIRVRATWDMVKMLALHFLRKS